MELTALWKRRTTTSSPPLSNLSLSYSTLPNTPMMMMMMMIIFILFLARAQQIQFWLKDVVEGLFFFFANLGVRREWVGHRSPAHLHESLCYL